MELTSTQLQLIETMHHKAQACLAQHRAWTEGNYKNYAFAEAEARLEEGVKVTFKAIINEWLETKGITAYTRSEIRVKHYPYPTYTNYQIQLNATSIFNGKGGLDKKSRWLNKITVSIFRQGVARLRSHAARTDPDFLEPAATEFTAFIQAIVDALDQ